MNTFHDRIQQESGAAETPWVELLESRLRERAAPAAGRGTLAERLARERDVARRIAHLPPRERLEAWVSETGASQATLYRRLAEVGGANSQTSHSDDPSENAAAA